VKLIERRGRYIWLARRKREEEDKLSTHEAALEVAPRGKREGRAGDAGRLGRGRVEDGEDTRTP
jgi:hypothetical protein